jgi:hypothetical protein
VSAETAAFEASSRRALGRRIAAVAVPCLITAATVVVAIRQPVWSIVAACCAALTGVLCATVLKRRLNALAGMQKQPAWLWWVLIGASGPLVGGAPDRVAVIPMAFLAAMTGALVGVEQRRRRPVIDISEGSHGGASGRSD